VLRGISILKVLKTLEYLEVIRYIEYLETAKYIKYLEYLLIGDSMSENAEYRMVKIKLDKNVYGELVSRYGIKSLSKAINQILREYLFRSEEEAGHESRPKPKSKLEELRERARRAKKKAEGLGGEGVQP